MATFLPDNEVYASFQAYYYVRSYKKEIELWCHFHFNINWKAMSQCIYTYFYEIIRHQQMLYFRGWSPISVTYSCITTENENACKSTTEFWELHKLARYMNHIYTSLLISFLPVIFTNIITFWECFLERESHACWT